MPNSQIAINDICKYRGLPPVKKGTKCTVDGESGIIFGGNSSANFNVKYDSDGRVRNCHPDWKMKIFNDDGSILYEHKDT